MDTAWLQDFLVLAETGSFSRAADQRNLTQPAFSRRIRALEDWLGASLFDRSVVPVTLTDPGRQFAPEARKLVDSIEAAQRLVRAAAQVSSTLVSIATTDALAPSFVPLLLSLLGDSIDGNLINVAVGSEADSEARLMRGQCQLLLRHHHPSAPALTQEAELTRTRIVWDQLVPVGSPTAVVGLDRGRLPLSIPVLAHDDASLLGQVFGATLTKRIAGADLNVAFVSQSATLLHAMALQGRGIAWLPLSLIQADILEQRLSVLPDKAWREPIEIVLIRNKTTGSKGLEFFWTSAAALGEERFGLSKLL